MRSGSADLKSAKLALAGSIVSEPCALIALAHRKGTRANLDNGVLTVSCDDFEIKVDEQTGTIQSIRSASMLPLGIAAVSVKVEKGAVARIVSRARQRAKKLPNRADDNHPFRSLAAYLVSQFRQQTAIRRNVKLDWSLAIAAASVEQPDVQQKIQAILGLKSERSSKKIFWIPADFDGAHDLNSSDLIYSFLPSVADELFPRGSWPWMTLRETALVRLSEKGMADGSVKNYKKSASQELGRMLSANDAGPVTLVTMASAYQQFPSNEKLIALIASQGLSDLSDQAVLKDSQLFVRGEHGLAIICRAAAATCGGYSDEEQQEILDCLPREWQQPMSRLFARRDEKPDELPGDAIEAVLLESWHCGLKEAVEARLKSMKGRIATAEAETQRK